MRGSVALGNLAVPFQPFPQGGVLNPSKGPMRPEVIRYKLWNFCTIQRAASSRKNFNSSLGYFSELQRARNYRNSRKHFYCEHEITGGQHLFVMSVYR
jgi:hypothetical protein